MTTKFKNAIIIKDFESDIIFGDLVVCDDKIVYVGKHTDKTADLVVDAKQNVIMPGFVNANATSYLSVLTGMVNGRKSQDFWAEVNNLQKKLTPEDVLTATKYSLTQYAKNGITTVGENAFEFDQLAKAYQDIGLRASIALKHRYNFQKYLDFEDLDKKYDEIVGESPLLTAHFACQDVVSDLEENFEMAEKLAQKKQTFVSANVCETLEEVGKCATQNSDMSPVELLTDYGFFDRNTMSNYATNACSKDIQILKRNNSNVCALPLTDSKLSNGIAPIYQMLQYDVNVCFGTGVGAVFGHYDMFSEMRHSVLSQNTLLSYADSISSKALLKMATTNGAKALGLSNVGALQEGNFADLILIDISDLIVHNIYDAIVYGCSSKNILLTMVNGKIIYDKSNQKNSEAEKEITIKAKKIASKI